MTWKRALSIAAAVLLPGGAIAGGVWWWMQRQSASAGRTSRWANKARRAQLDPAFLAKADALLSALDAAGIPVVVTDGVRTDDEQNALYAQGRTQPGAIVTNARAGESAHNKRKALDVAPQTESGAPHWPDDPALWERIGTIGERVGLVWGGRWTKPDRPHFEAANWRDGVA